jgi:hypothetical protein
MFGFSSRWGPSVLFEPDVTRNPLDKPHADDGVPGPAIVEAPQNHVDRNDTESTRISEFGMLSAALVQCPSSPRFCLYI